MNDQNLVTYSLRPLIELPEHATQMRLKCGFQPSLVVGIRIADGGASRRGVEPCAIVAERISGFSFVRLPGLPVSVSQVACWWDDLSAVETQFDDLSPTCSQPRSRVTGGRQPLRGHRSSRKGPVAVLRSLRLIPAPSTPALQSLSPTTCAEACL